MTTRLTRGTGTRFPLGAWGVALALAAVGAIIGLIMPLAWIEEASWQLYLDQLIAAARPPLGPTARLAAMAALALGFGLLGWLAAFFMKIRPSDASISTWLDGLRSTRADDEPDAPRLRAGDRHPDAPARRPFSAARDVPVDAELAPTALRRDIFDVDDDDELLLDAQFDEAIAPAPLVSEAERAARWDALEHVDAVDEAPAVDPAPTLDRATWLTPTIAETTPPEIAPGTLVEPAPVQPAVVAAPMPPPVPEPLDLSIARLDELIARLESGLARRAALVVRGGNAVAETAEPVIARAGDLAAAAAMPADAPVDASFPHDPALAAALETLRRMNRSA